MTTNPHFCNALVSLVADLSRTLSTEQRYQRLLAAFRQIFPVDATSLLKLEGDSLIPLAVDGLSDDTLGRRFIVAEQPRLAKILHSRSPVRFAADSDLPDPYDGLVEPEDAPLNVHDCMGASLYIDDMPWGVLTLDALRPGTFDDISPIELRTFISLSEAAVKAAELISALETRMQQMHQVTRTLLEESGQIDMVGKSKQMLELKQEIDVVAQSDLAVLVLGETGVGKELVAHQVHALSARAKQAMVYINCAALPENIAESELFGHVKGAFSGAVSDRTGKFELANSGTLFLDEIGELPLSVQAKLLRVLQNGEIQRVGSDRYIKVDVRIVAATNRDLKQEVTKGRFRADLYHRLAIYPVYVPPLRERGNDILLLTGLFLEKNQYRLGVPGLRLSNDAKRALLKYNWPGNIRELEHLISRAALKAVTAQGHQSRIVTISLANLDISTTDLPQESELPKDKPASVKTKMDLKEAVEQFQRDLISQQLAAHNNNLAATAQDLGLDRSNFYRLLKRLGIHPATTKQKTCSTY